MKNDQSSKQLPRSVCISDGAPIKCIALKITFFQWTKYFTMLILNEKNNTFMPTEKVIKKLSIYLKLLSVEHLFKAVSQKDYLVP